MQVGPTKKLREAKKLSRAGHAQRAKGSNKTVTSARTCETRRDSRWSDTHP